MMKPEPGSVVLVQSRPPGAAPDSPMKRRPAIVVSWDAFHNQRGAIVALPVSGAPVRDGFEVAITRWREVGLPVPSKVRLGQFLLLDAEADYVVLGCLPPQDLARLRHGITAVFGSM